MKRTINTANNGKIKEVTQKLGNCRNVLVALDFINAFNAANQNLILRKLEGRKISQHLINIIADRFCRRYVQVSKGSKLEVKTGVPQRSVLRLTLWYILYNEILEISLQGRAKTIAFSDDLALKVTADTKESLMCNTNKNLK